MTPPVTPPVTPPSSPLTEANAVASTYAGLTGVVGSTSGSTAIATFHYPGAVALDGAGSLYVADTWGGLIRKITAGSVTTLPGSYSMPNGLVVDSQGSVLITATATNTIQKVTSTGVTSTFAGSGAVGSAPGQGVLASFSAPWGIALDSSGNVYVADSGSHIIRKITSTGLVSTFAGTAGVPGHANGQGTAASFNTPTALAVDGSGNLYVCDTGNNTIRMITPTGLVSTPAGTAGVQGHADGTGAAASFYTPQGIAVDAAGNVFVMDTFNQTLRLMASGGVVTTLAGTVGTKGATNGAGNLALFSGAQGLAVDASDNVYVADASNSLIRKLTF